MSADFTLRHLLDICRALRLAQKGNLARGIKPDPDTARRLEAALDHFIAEEDGRQRKQPTSSGRKLERGLKKTKRTAEPASTAVNEEEPNKSLLEIFETELAAQQIKWCKGCDSYGGHKRGFATRKTRTVHMDTKMARRGSLLGGLHEIGHIVANTPDMRRWQEEKSATEWAYKRMKELGISIPRKERKGYKDYIARMKIWGKNIAAGRR